MIVPDNVPADIETNENDRPNDTRRVAPARAGYRGFNAWGASQLVRIGPDLANSDISLTENANTLPAVDDDDDNDRQLFNGIHDTLLINSLIY